MKLSVRAALDLCFAVRPLLWIPAIVLFAAGERWGRAVAGAPPSATSGAAALGALVLLLAAVHVANGWRDRAGDRVNRKGRAVSSGAVSGLALAAVAGSCLAGALPLAFHPDVGGASRTLLAVAGLLGAAYVAPGVELKRRAGFDLLSHGVGYGMIAFLLGVSSTAAAGWRTPEWVPALAASAPYAAGILAVALVAMIADAEGDASSGQRTLAVRLGAARAWALARGFAWAALLLGLAVHEWIPALWGLTAAVQLSLRAPQDAAASGESGEADAANRCAILLQILFIALLAPWAPVAALAAVAVAGIASIYGAWRWRESYPWNRLAAGGRRAASGTSEEV